MIKPGSAYEQAVAAVLSACSPTAEVTQGEWVEGPDGRRDLDVFIKTSTPTGVQTILVECKDFNPNTTGPVGIAFVDALDSKRRDLGATHAILCSNAGFTSDAIRKVSRLGFGAIAVLSEGDDRIRFAVREAIYTRRIRLRYWDELSVPGVAPQTEYPAVTVHLAGRPLSPWLAHRAFLFIGTNPVVFGRHKFSYQLKEPSAITWPAGSMTVASFGAAISIDGGWFEHEVELEATTGIYDWVNRRLHVGPGPGRYEYRGLNIHAGTPVRLPPPAYLNRSDPTDPTPHMTLIVNLPDGASSDPIIEALIEPADLDVHITGLETITYTSVDGFDG